MTYVSISKPLFRCTECGSAVADQLRHDSWHAQLAGEIEKELLKDKETQCTFLQS